MRYSLRLSVRCMYRVRRDDPQELSVVSDVRCKIRMLKILYSILLFPFFHNFVLINNNKINKKQRKKRTTSQKLLYKIKHDNVKCKKKTIKKYFKLKI